MLIRKRQANSLCESDCVDERHYLKRRDLLKGAGLIAGGLCSGAEAGVFDFWTASAGKDPVAEQEALNYTADTQNAALPLTPESKILHYNNYYEFGTDKGDPARNAQAFSTKPWTLQVEGEVGKPGTVDVWELLHSGPLLERIYRMRCVEAWSMVIPWVGLELGKFLQRFEPSSRAKYVAFETIYAPEQMPGQKSRFVGGGIDYPYVEGLRIDEAMHPLTLLAVGIYGKTLAPQNGAPLRLVVPWKYGFKGIKAIVKIRLQETQPRCTWNELAPGEYGFYANVNPTVDHPRWSQASERFIGPGAALNVVRQHTLPFNGYSEVASLYSQLDLKKNY